MTQANRHLPLLLSMTLTACGPAKPSESMDGATSDVAATSTTNGGTGGTTDQADSGGSTTPTTEFSCPDARWHEGDLEIDDTTMLDSLRDVGGVRGSLRVAETSTIVDLSFLLCLEEIEGRVTIRDNAALAELSGLERLRNIHGNTDGVGPKLWDLGLMNNPTLSKIGSLDSLEELGALVVQSNESLTEIEMSALRQIDALQFGGDCHAIGPDQPLMNVGSYPALEHVGFLLAYGQYGLTSLDSLVELAERGVVFDEAAFLHNYNLPQSEIDAFAAAASLTPETCSNMDDTEECPPCDIK